MYKVLNILYHASKRQTFMLQQNKSLSNSLLNFSILKKLLDIHKFRNFFLIILPYIAISRSSFKNKKKSRTYVRQIWKILRDKTNLIDLRKGTLKKMHWEAT